MQTLHVDRNSGVNSDDQIIRDTIDMNLERVASEHVEKREHAAGCRGKGA